MSDDRRAWLGRGLEDVPGKPFGWAYAQERDAIKVHVLRRYGWGARLDQATALHKLNLEAYVTKVQERLHRNKPTLRERQAQWKARQPVPVAGFNVEELEHLAEHFAGANDPVGQSICAKAAAMVETRKR